MYKLSQEEEWIANQVTTMLHAVIEFVNNRKKPKLAGALLVSFMSALIAEMVVSSLTPTDDKLTENEKYKIAADNFAALKTALSEAVSTGLSLGMKDATSEEIEYFCNILVIPKPSNKEMC